MVGGFALAGLLHVVLPVRQVTRHLGRPGLGGVLKAAVIGMPLPLCSCSVIPVASAIRKQGASRGATGSFLISVPETGVDSFAVSYALLGPVLAVLRPIAALITAVVAGLAIDRLTGEDIPASATPPEGRPAEPSCCSHKRTDQGDLPPNAVPTLPTADDCCEAKHSGPTNALRLKIREALHYGFVTMFEDLAVWLAIGFILAGLIAALVPDDFVERHIGTGPVAMLLMLIAGLPMYVCATASTPVAATLIAKGLSPGAALVFLLAGPATNIATMVVVARQLGRRSLVIYLVSIAVVAILIGIATDLLLTAWPMFRHSVETHVHGRPALIGWPFAVILTALILNGLRLHWGRKKPAV